MAQTAAQQIADAKAENYWAAVERRNEKRRAQRAEAKSRPVCCQCKAAPVMKGMSFGGHCASCDVEMRRLFGPEEYARMYSREV